MPVRSGAQTLCVGSDRTLALARSSYVDPRVVTAWENGSTIQAALRRASRLIDDERQSAVERATIRLLRRLK
ncbi:hypothetical protein ACHIPZ_03575 [Antrihabitans sp. NCIMB 15449]|jgi:DNA topoisomerase I|uniref:Uncharacterized protein n=1 Tax=Antrihabitans spumae TaxID=3373370 RepID=A0ABW7JJB4_9NOCA